MRAARRKSRLCEPPADGADDARRPAAYVREPFEVFVNGVPQVEGTDYEVVGSSLLFNRSLAREGKLGLWRWLSMLLGIAGTYRKNDTIDVVFTVNGRRKVVRARRRRAGRRRNAGLAARAALRLAR